MNPRPPQLSPRRLLLGLLLPLVAYTLIRAAIGSATGALAITEGVAAAWLLIVAVARRRVDPVAALSTVTVAIALAVYALTGGDPLALKLRRGAVTGTIGIAALASIAIGRPLLIAVAQHVAKINPERQPEIEAKLSDPQRRRVLTILTAIIGTTFTVDGATQIALALVVPTGRFVADSTAVRIAVFGTGLVLTMRYLRHHRAPRAPHRGPPPQSRRGP
ncbi:MAG: VC0807 family protein [Solirubrobacteraceae bacterium]